MTQFDIMTKLNTSDNELITLLHKLVFEDKIISDILSNAFISAYSKFNEKDYILPYASKDTSIEPFNKKMPDYLQCFVKMCRVFILKKGMRFPFIENHKNSIQRLVSYKGSGIIYKASSNKNISIKNFIPTPLCSPKSTNDMDLSKYWNIVPANTWHFPEAGNNKDWLTVTFHSANSEQIIDDYQLFPQ